jgi:RNase P/RNase MRP subunit POP5
MAQKMQRLLPSLREKKRYLVFRILSKSHLGNAANTLKLLKLELSSYFGQMGMADAGIQVLSDTYNPEEQSGAIRVGHKYVNRLKSALMFITSLDDKEVIVKSVTVSGMINKAKTYV